MYARTCSFSALQRAENSSIKLRPAAAMGRKSVSVLFSEPKIPQLYSYGFGKIGNSCFSALQRAENSSIIVPRVAGTTSSEFQCSSASRKFLNLR
mgnify:CR=1 FL=1